jgi:prepilin-type N-terminal cleavage/methylation domain-containing protein
MKENPGGGFTFLEVLIAVAILGIVAALGMFRLSAFHKAKELEEEGRALFSSVANARALALKRDRICFLKLDPASNSYGVYEDLNGNGAAEASEKVSDHAFPARIGFGSPQGGPARGPGGSGDPALKIEAAWRNLMVLGTDRVAGVNEGSLYLRSNGLDERTVCIRKSAGTLQLEMWSWDGTRWNAL